MRVRLHVLRRVSRVQAAAAYRALLTLLRCRSHALRTVGAGSQMSGSFWVSRLLRDRDTVLRAQAVEVLGRLLQPGADTTQSLVAQGWSDAVKTMIKIALDRNARFALRTAAMRVLVCCMAQEASADGKQVRFLVWRVKTAMQRSQVRVCNTQ